MQLIQAAIDPELVVVVPAAHAVGANGSEAVIERRVGGDDHAGVPGGAKVFGGIEGGAGQVGKAAGGPPSVSGTDSLGVVFDYFQAESLGNGIDRVHVTGQTIQMHGHDGLGALGDRSFDQGRIDIEAGSIDVDKDWNSTAQADGFDCGGKGEGAGDHFVAGPDV